MSRMTQGVGNTQITGAGSTLQMRWPRGITDGGDPTGPAKFGPQEYNGWQIAAAAPGAQATTVYGGAAAVDFQTGNTGSFMVATARTLSWFTERTGGPVLNGWSCWSVRTTMALANPVGAFQQDVGVLLFMPGIGNAVLGGGTGVQTLPGVVFGPSGPQSIALRARAVNGAAITINAAVPAGLTPDITTYNTYELQILTGSNTSDPVLIALINGVQVLGPFAWTLAAGLLPNPGAVSGQTGYEAGVANNAGANVPHLHVEEICVTAGQSAADII